VTIYKVKNVEYSEGVVKMTTLTGTTILSTSKDNIQVRGQYNGAKASSNVAPPAGTATGTGTYAGTGKTTYYYSECHKGNVFIFQHKNIHFHAGGINRQAKEVPGWLTINLTISGSFGVEPKLQYHGFKAKYLEKWRVPLGIHIPIQDFKYPHWPREFWLDLVKELEKLAQNKEELNVLVVCDGGHGRTGLVMGILLGLLTTERNPIEHLRKIYCNSAVETQEQAEYVKKITGKNFDPKAFSYSKGYGAAGGAGYGYKYGDYDDDYGYTKGYTATKTGPAATVWSKAESETKGKQLKFPDYEDDKRTKEKYEQFAQMDEEAEEEEEFIIMEDKLIEYNLSIDKMAQIFVHDKQAFYSIIQYMDAIEDDDDKAIDMALDKIYEYEIKNKVVIKLPGREEKDVGYDDGMPEDAKYLDVFEHDDNSVDEELADDLDSSTDYLPNEEQ
jgi:protein-tyrosine phosphatase